MGQTLTAAPKSAPGGLGFFERYLSLWVALCMAAGVAFGKLVPAFVQHLRGVAAR